MTSWPTRRRSAPATCRYCCLETGEGEVRRVIRESVIRALAAAGEWPIRVDVVTSTGSDDGRTKRWFVEYETGPYGQVIDQPDQCG
jgi:hypothetical protein